MSEIGQLNVNVRTGTGKNASNRIRATGLVPAVIYGRGQAQISVSIEPKALRKSLDPARKFNTILEVSVRDGDKEVGREHCMIVDVQFNPIREEILHVDFMRINDDTEVTVVVPVNYIGRPVGVVAGGKLRTFRRTVKVAAAPSQLPAAFDVDISPRRGVRCPVSPRTKG